MNTNRFSNIQSQNLIGNYSSNSRINYSSGFQNKGLPFSHIYQNKPIENRTEFTVLNNNNNLNFPQTNYPQKYVQQHTITPNSQIVYNHQAQNSYKPSSFITNTQPHFIQNQTHPSFIKFSTPTNPNLIGIITQNNVNKSFSQFRRDVSPINSRIKLQKQYSSINNQDLEKYEVARWRNKYQDLKTKYFELLSIVQKNNNIQDTWILQEENKLLKQKVKVFQEKDQHYYHQVSQRIQKMIDFHKQTTNQQCQLLIDRYRLENKFLQKF